MRFKADFITFLTTHVPDATSHVAFKTLRKKITELPGGYRSQKKRIICVRLIAQNYRELYTEKLVRAIVADGFTGHLQAIFETKTWRPYYTFESEVETSCHKLPDQEFLAQVGQYVKDEPLIELATRQAIERVYTHLDNALKSALGQIASFILERQKDTAKLQLDEKLRTYEADRQKKSTDIFVQDINSASETAVTSCVAFRAHVFLNLISSPQYPHHYFEAYS